jgi:hypothetical protein
MAVQINLPDDDDWEGWVRMTQQLAINLERQKHRAKLASGNTGDNHGNGNNKNNNSNQTGDPMDLDKLHLNKLSPAERGRRQREGLCFYCGKAGHVVSECQETARNTNNHANRGRGRGGNGAGRGGQNYVNPASGYAQPQQQFPSQRYNYAPNYQQFPQQFFPLRGGRSRGGAAPQLRAAGVPAQGAVLGEVDDNDSYDTNPSNGYWGTGSEVDDNSTDIQSQGKGRLLQ